MPDITGHFDADFTKFRAAVEGAEVTLKSFEGDANKAQAQLQKMSDAFSGAKVIAQAELMVEAVKRLGGTAMLTDTQFAKLSSTTREAVDQMSRLGMTVPQDMARIAAETRPVVDETKNIGTAAKLTGNVLGGIGAQMAGAFTVGAVVGFGREILATADRVQKMADQTGMATEEIQRLEYIAGQSGTSMGSLVSAAQNLQISIGDSGSGAVAAMKRLGIESESFNRLSTYDQLILLSGELKNITNPTELAATAAALFGKNWKEILPAIKSGMSELAAMAPVMGDATIKSLDGIGDALTRAKAQMIDWGGTTVGWIEKVAYGVGLLFTPGDLYPFQTALDVMTTSFMDLAIPIPEVGGALQDLGLDMEEITQIQFDLDREIANSIQLHKLEAETLKQATADSKKWEAEQKTAMLATSKTINEYNTLRVERGGNANEIEIARIHEWSDNVKTAAEAANTATTAFLTAHEALTREKLRGVGVEWDTVYSKSREALQHTAERHRATYDEMRTGALHYTREVMSEQLAKTREAEEAARGMGRAYVDGLTSAKAAAEALSEKLAKARKDADDATAAVRRMGGTFELQKLAVTDANRAGLLAEKRQIEASYVTAPGRRAGGSGATGTTTSQGWSQMLEEQQRYAQLKAALPGAAGGMQNFGGGPLLVGERGPEVLTLPRGSGITPNSALGGTIVTNHIYVNGTAEDVARKVMDEITRTMKTGRKWPSN